MKISLNTNRVQNIYMQNAKCENQVKVKNNTGDKIEISNTSREISKYMDTAKNTEILNKRIEEVKSMLSKGNYKVSSEELAKSILQYIKERD